MLHTKIHLKRIDTLTSVQWSGAFLYDEMWTDIQCQEIFECHKCSGTDKIQSGNYFPSNTFYLWEIKTFLQKPSLNCTVFFFSSWKILHWSKMGNFPAAKGRALALNIDMFCLHLCETFNCSVDNYPTITRF